MLHVDGTFIEAANQTSPAADTRQTQLFMYGGTPSTYHEGFRFSKVARYQEGVNFTPVDGNHEPDDDTVFLGLNTLVSDAYFDAPIIVPHNAYCSDVALKNESLGTIKPTVYASSSDHLTNAWISYAYSQDVVIGQKVNSLFIQPGTTASNMTMEIYECDITDNGATGDVDNLIKIAQLDNVSVTEDQKHFFFFDDYTFTKSHCMITMSSSLRLQYAAPIHTRYGSPTPAIKNWYRTDGAGAIPLNSTGPITLTLGSSGTPLGVELFDAKDVVDYQPVGVEVESFSSRDTALFSINKSASDSKVTVTTNQQPELGAVEAWLMLSQPNF